MSRSRRGIPLLGMALIVAAVAAATVTRVSTAAPAEGCVVHVSSPSGSGDTVATTGGCYQAGKEIPTRFTHRYTLLDYGRASCGTFSGTGRSLTPRLSGTYYIQVTFTASPLRTTRQVRPKSETTQFILGHAGRQCGHFTTPPPASTICTPQSLSFLSQYAPNAFSHGPLYGQVGNFAADPCGEMLYGTVEGPQSWLPRWGGPPLLIGDTIYPPRILTQSSGCVLNSNRGAHDWTCGKAWVDPWLYIYYLPPGGTSICPEARGGTPPSYADYTLGPVNSSKDPNTQFKLPTDWKTWGGRMVILYHAVVIPEGDVTNPYFNHLLGWEYATTEITLSGSANGCTELSK